MSGIDKTNAGRRVQLVYCNDPYTNLKCGDQGTYEYANRCGFETQHSIKWDNGSTLMLLEGVDSFKFLS